MQPNLSRADYNRLFLSEPAPRGADPGKFLRSQLAKHYPCNTPQVVIELRSRGLDADAQHIHYLLRVGSIAAPKRDGRDYAWTAADIDRIAAILADAGRFTPSGNRCLIEGSSFAQDIEAEREARRLWPLVNPAMLVRVVLPGHPGRGIPAQVEYRPMTREEQERWETSYQE